jgi:hypothetical protein
VVLHSHGDRLSCRGLQVLGSHAVDGTLPMMLGVAWYVIAACGMTGAFASKSEPAVVGYRTRDRNTA